MSHPYTFILEYAKFHLEQEKEKYFCTAAFDLLKEEKISKETCDAFREWVHRMLHPMFSMNYYHWMEDNHFERWKQMHRDCNHLQARLAWANHLIKFLEEL